ncbi:MAG TPA: hypothetical protein VD699_01325 [Nitrosopumilaceae archaeon]|nr:hypothetical protein [Nitrosopumilaceae archaeon]
MPDESCRICGGELISHYLCSECRQVTQRICRMCGSRTNEQIHDKCLYLEPHAAKTGIKTEIVMLPNPAIRTKKSHPFRNMLIAFGIVCVFILGSAVAAQLNNFEVPLSSVEPKSFAVTEELLNLKPRLVHSTYENCLAYGNGESITLKCPTEKGQVYSAVLVMPPDLEARFSDDVFHIRGVSLIENLDGSLYLKYQNKLYHTGYIGHNLFS